MHQPASERELWGVLTLTLAYLAVASIAIFKGRNEEFMIYLAVMVVVISAVVKIHHYAGLSFWLLLAFSVWGCLHMGGGLVPVPKTWTLENPPHVLYNWWIIPGYLKYDQVVHGYGVALTTWLCWQVLSRRVRSRDGGPLVPTGGMVTLCAVAGMGFGALNEVIEFLASLVLEETNIGGYINTGWDLVANLIGGGVVALLIYGIGSQRRNHAAHTIPH